VTASQGDPSHRQPNDGTATHHGCEGGTSIRAPGKTNRGDFFKISSARGFIQQRNYQQQHETGMDYTTNPPGAGARLPREFD
jgi:hypothetical protein